jgi:hypothetical protein
LLDQTEIALNAANFQKVLAWLDSQPSTTEAEGIRRLLAGKPVWNHD